MSSNEEIVVRIMYSQVYGFDGNVIYITLIN